MKKFFLIAVLILSALAYFYFKYRKPDLQALASKFNTTLVRQLDSIYTLDQKYRSQLDSVQQKYSFNSPRMQSLIKSMRNLDSLNLIKVQAILDQQGWLGTDVIGQNGNAALFLVIQHSSQSTQEKYLPMMRKAVKEGKAEATDLALLEDRVLIGQGKKQRYGSQVIFNDAIKSHSLLPLADPDHVDQRRHAIGLSSLADYLNTFQIKWDAEQYKKDLAHSEAKRN